MRACRPSGRLSSVRIFDPASLMTEVISASIPVRSLVRMSRWTGKVAPVTLMKDCTALVVPFQQSTARTWNGHSFS